MIWIENSLNIEFKIKHIAVYIPNMGFYGTDFKKWYHKNIVAIWNI